MLRVETSAGAIIAPAYVYPGLRGDTIAVAFGRGHTAYGRYAKNVGVNPGDLLTAVFDAKSGAQAWTSTKVKVSKTGDFVPLVSTEGSARQHGRGIARAIDAKDLGIVPTPGATEQQGSGERAKDAGGEEHMPGDASHEFLPGLRAPVAQDAQGDLPSDDNKKGMYDPNHWSGMARRRWAMTVDLARCTGCSACVTACYAENNIPTVGAVHQASATVGLDGQPGANILRGREMAWIRLERYFEGGETLDDTFETRFVPMLCQQCGNAPCEPVCPVYATYHSPDGLNVQVYNRCVGTRYCSNNCPYKVRYFNWFGYGEPARPQYAWPERMNWQLNPDVTVRGKGVMEKCTFCVQRIRESENRAKLEGRALEADEFTTSCAQACPSNAITFGDAADDAWSVTKIDRGQARLSRVRGAQHVHSGGVFEEGQSLGRGGGVDEMTAVAPDAREKRRNNIATADVQLPAVANYTQVTDEILDTLRITKAWFLGLGIAVFCLLIGAAAWFYQIYMGLGVAGYRPPVMWGVYIITFVFWVGIGHAGTLISAILYLFRAGFRTTIYRCAEVMTVFAVMTAGLFPILHLGRPWKFFWLIPYPNWRLIWPQFKSPLVWDVFAILTYLTVSATFLFIGLIPDLAVLRDRETNPVRKQIYGVLSFGWRNSDREWRHFARAYLFLAAFSTPLVLSVHSVVSFDFAMANLPGWHTTIFPPYFVAGAIFSGIGMVFTIIIPMRRWFNLKHYVTLNVLDAAAKLCLFTSLVVGCAYLTEFFIAWYSGSEIEQAYFWNRVFGQWWWAAWIMLTCNGILPMLLFSQRLRRNTTFLFTLSIFINLGMWYERFVIIVPSMSHEFEPWQWAPYAPTYIDWAILIGSFGWFAMWFLLFVKQLPIMAIAEIKEIVPPRMRHAHREEDPEGHSISPGLIGSYEVR